MVPWPSIAHSTRLLHAQPLLSRDRPRVGESDSIGLPPDQTPSLAVSPSWRDPAHPTAHDRFRQIFRDHWDSWCYLRLDAEVPLDQQAYVHIEKLPQRKKHLACVASHITS